MFDILMPYTVFLLLGELLLIGCWFLGCLLYRALEELRCIYVETAEDKAGYSLQYWVSVDSGLLVQAEKRLRGELIYRMSAPQVDQTELDASKFALPDGTPLLKEENGESQ